jgi:hypothetical protein
VRVTADLVLAARWVEIAHVAVALGVPARAGVAVADLGVLILAWGDTALKPVGILGPALFVTIAVGLDVT